MPYTINRNKTLGLAPRDPPKDVERMGKLQREYINRSWRELFKALERRAMEPIKFKE